MKTKRTPIFLCPDSIDKHVQVLNRPLFEYSHIAGLVPAHPWSGPCFVVVEEQKKGVTAYIDFSWRDLRPMLSKLSQLGEAWGVLNFKKSQPPAKQSMVVGAILACDGEVELFDTKPTELMELFFTGEKATKGV